MSVFTLKSRIIKSLWLCLLLLAYASSLQARDFPAFYERDYETAQKLDDLYERLKDADTLFMLDSVSDAIVNHNCRKEDQAYWRAYNGSKELMNQLGNRKPTANEVVHYKKLKEEEKRNWDLFEKCFTKQIRLPVFANNLPPGIDSYNKAISRYNELIKQHSGKLTEGYIDADIVKIEDEIKKLESKDPYVAVVTASFSNVKLIRKGATPVKLNRGTELIVGDIIITGSRSRTRIEMYDRIEEKNAGPTVLNIGSNSEVQVTRFYMQKTKKRVVEKWKRQKKSSALDRLVEIDVYRGFIRALTKGFGGRAAFSVRTGTALCGIRGTEVEINYDPQQDLVDYKLLEGVVEITTPSKKLNLEQGHSLQIRGGVAGEPKPLPPVQPTAPPV
ncbi:MAG: FecR family protein [Candidatus Thiodiazotropha sp. (ex. Lucinisca nassula)]|nr:FecR family protein [Candidatus Thiodiazotropha sp. (ex. Lucinisca nassula)]